MRNTLNFYVNFVKNYPILSAIMQFAILGTFAEVISRKIVHAKVFEISVALRKAVVWSILAVMIRYAFVRFFGFVHSLVSAYLPSITSSNVFVKAFFVSTFTNLIFGLVTIYSNRFLDNIFMKKHNYSNMTGALWTLV